MAKPKKRASRARRPGPLDPASISKASVAAPAPSAPLLLPRPLGLWYGVMLFLSLIQPVAGLTLGALYARQEDRSARVFGYWCLGLALLGWFVSATTGAVKSALGSGEWFVQPYY